MNEEGQLELSFGWRATHVMSLRGFQLFHLRSKRSMRLLLLLLFSLTFYTVTSFDRGWGREEKTIASERPIVLNRLQSFLSSRDKAMLLQLTHFFFPFTFLDAFVIKLLFPVHGTLAFSQIMSPAQDRKEAFIWPQALATADLMADRCHIFPQSYCKLRGGMLGTRSLTAVVFLLCFKSVSHVPGNTKGSRIARLWTYFFLLLFIC